MNSNARSMSHFNLLRNEERFFRAANTAMGNIALRVKNPERWVSGELAVDNDNNPVSVDDPKAMRYSVLGSLYKEITNPGMITGPLEIDFIKAAMAPEDEWPDEITYCAHPSFAVMQYLISELNLSSIKLTGVPVFEADRHESHHEMMSIVDTTRKKINAAYMGAAIRRGKYKAKQNRKATDTPVSH